MPSRSGHTVSSRYLAVGLAVVCLGMASVSEAELRAYRAQKAQGPAVTPDSLDELAPESLMRGFTNSADKPAAVQTRAAVLYDEDNLYFVVECLEPDMDTLVAKCSKRDGDVFSDDCVEIFISPTRSETEYCHLATNALGTRFDEKVKDRSWNPSWTVKATRGERSWTLVVDIPFAAIGGKPAQGSVWWFNVDRQRARGGKLELSAWSPTGSNFHDVSCFGALVFDDHYGRYLATDIVQPWDGLAKRLRDRAKIDPEAAGRLSEALDRIEAELTLVREAAKTSGPAPLKQFAKRLETGLNALKELKEAGSDLDAAIAQAEAAQAMRKLAQPGQELLAYAVRAITNRKILPAPKPPESASPIISMRACRGEYEPGSFVVYPLAGTVLLDPKVSDLRGPQGVIGADAVNLRAVKCWYQSGEGGRFPINKRLHVLTPELLLKDDDLVRVDYENKENFVKLQFPDGETRWLWISSLERTPEERDTSVEAMPIKDAQTLQPVAIPRETAKQFWVTVHVPQDARAGKYEGKIELWSVGRLVETLKLELEVLPFDLEPNPLESSVYFHWGIVIDEEGNGTVEHRTRTWAQYRAELENLLAHGVDNPTLGVRFDTGLLPNALKLRQDIGMRMDNLYYLIAGTGTPAEQIKQIIKIAHEHGYSDVYFYGHDEARGDSLKAQRPIWERVHEAGGKVFVAGSRGHNFPAMGDLQDLLVCYGDPTKEEAALWHSKGHKIFCYANPQSGIEEPETYRRNFGLLLAVNDYDGGMTYIYYHGWNDYYGKRYRQHNFVYPTVDGVVDTIQWEGYREGIDDLRYLGTLRKAIAKAKQGGPAAGEAAKAQAFVDSMDVSGDLYAIRKQIIGWIVKLSGAGK